MMSFILTQPTEEPVTVDEVRTLLRVEGDDDAFSSIIESLIPTARQLAEVETGRRLMQQVVRYEFEDWPCDLDDDPLPEADPSAVAISYWNGSAWATLATNAYAWAPSGPGRAFTSIAPALNTNWPALGEVAVGPRVRIDVTVGAANQSEVPQPAKTFIAAAVGHMLADPGASGQNAPAPYLRNILSTTVQR